MKIEASEEPVELPRASASEDRADRLVGIVKRFEDILFVPVFTILLSSPIWGTILGIVLDWPLWLTLCVAVVPALSLFVSGQLHMALRKWTSLRRAQASSFELPLIVVLLLVGVALPLVAYYL
ncbi:MAG TPA: hypothetical protein VFZ12_01390 [Dehalococcoidia bacterium]|nr:hypothetical protein [Dehalococcoidia bacterium]